MTNKIITLILAIISIVNVIYSFWQNPASERIFGFEINTWIYRIIWIAFASIFISDVIKKFKKNV